MSKVLVEESSLQNIANAIRTMSNKTDKYMPSEMATAINNIQTLKGGGYKVNITQSEHQTITVSQFSFDNRTAGFTIDDYPSIKASITADPGYTAGSLNRTNFTFSNDVREVDIFATAATQSPNITYNGNMNVFLTTLNSGAEAFNITTGTKHNVFMGEYALNEAFALTLAADGDNSFENLAVNYNDNFYNLDPNCKYRITAIKIGDTSLSDADISDGSPDISSSTSVAATYINADSSKTWVKSVYKQCTGKEPELSYVDLFSPENLDDAIQAKNLGDVIQDGKPSDAKDAYLGEQIANTIFGFFGYYKPTTSDYVRFDVDEVNDSFDEFDVLSKEQQKKYSDDVDAFMAAYKANPTIFRTGNLVQGYYAKLEALQEKYANNEVALNILKQYNPATNEQQHGLRHGFATLDFTITNPDLFELTYWIDPSDRYGFLASLPGGNAYVLWLFYARYVAAEIIMADSNNELAGFAPYFKPDTPTISTIPVSITFTNVTQ